MAELTAQQLARRRLASIDIARFAPPPPEHRNEPEKPKFTDPTVKLSDDERRAKNKAYQHAYYMAHRDERRAEYAERKKANPGQRSSSLEWYYRNHEHCAENNRKWREKNQDRKTEYMREWRRKHPGYFSKKNREARKLKRNAE